MKNKIPLYCSVNRSQTFFFNAENIQSPESIESVSLVLTADEHIHSERGFDISANPFLLDTENLRLLPFCEKKIRSTRDKEYTIIDISEIFISMAMGFKKNNGVLAEPVTFIPQEGEIIIKYRDEIIAPGGTCGCRKYWEKSLIISGISKAETPWLLTKYCSDISFYVKNLSSETLVVSLENSPNAIDSSADAQRLIVQPNETKFITPYSFSKYTRLVAHSLKDVPLIAKVWIQAILY